LVKVTLRDELVCPTVTVPKFSELVENVTGAEPEPDRLTVCGLLEALSAKVSVPLAAPTAVGENVTPTWQRAPAARLVVQVLLEIANGAAVVMEVIDSATDCMFVRVTVLAELVAPTTVELKLRLFEDNVTGALPLPLRFTVCGLVAALSVKVRVPVALPNAVGLNVTPTVQVAPAAIAPKTLRDLLIDCLLCRAARRWRGRSPRVMRIEQHRLSVTELTITRALRADVIRA